MRLRDDRCREATGEESGLLHPGQSADPVAFPFATGNCDRGANGVLGSAANLPLENVIPSRRLRWPHRPGLCLSPLVWSAGLVRVCRELTPASTHEGKGN